MLDKEKLLQDRAGLEALISKAQADLQQLQLQIVRWDGALSYINDNLKSEEGEEKCSDKT